MYLSPGIVCYGFCVTGAAVGNASISLIKKTSGNHKAHAHDASCVLQLRSVIDVADHNLPFASKQIVLYSIDALVLPLLPPP